MSGYGGFSNSGSNNQSMSKGQFDQRVWGGQKPFLQDLYGQLSGLFNQTNQGINQQLPGAINQANQTVSAVNPAFNNLINGGAYGNIDASKLQDQIYSSMQAPTASQQINNMIMGGAGNNYADAMKSQYVQDANIATKNMLNNLDARASVAGMPGSSRQGIAQGVGIQGINQNLQRNLAETGYNTFDKDLDRKLAIAGQADQANLARQGMLSSMLAGKQNSMLSGLGMAGDVANIGNIGMNMYNAPWQAMGNWANILGRPTILGSGSNSAMSSGSSNSMGMSGGGGASVICTEFHRQGYMADDVYLLDELFGEYIRFKSPHVYDGYVSWAPVVVNVMRKSPALTRMMWVFGKPWSEQMAYEMGVGNSNFLGSIIMKVGLSICSFIGKLKTQSPLEA